MIKFCHIRAFCLVVVLEILSDLEARLHRASMGPLLLSFHDPNHPPNRWTLSPEWRIHEELQYKMDNPRCLW